MRAHSKKNLWIVPIYGILYLIMFFVLENRPAVHHVIHSSLDDMIPFCEYFIVPYFLWFIYMGVTVLYFMFVNESSKEYRQLISILGTGMTVFLVVSYVFPNCHHLRPSVTGDNFFSKAVKLLHVVDTSTNLLPSIHVFNSLACHAALYNNEPFRKHKVLTAGSGILTGFIILSTMFLKQHSVVDVITAFLLFGVCYWIFYKFIPENQELLDTILMPEQVVTIPNVLSLFRLFLAIFFWGTGVKRGFPGKQAILAGTLFLNVVTDFLDGFIARKYNMNSEFGKLLDFLADKATQGVLLLHFVTRYPLLQMTLMIFGVKEISMLLVSSKLLMETGKSDRAMWYGKLSTVVFYVVMNVLIVFPKLEMQTANCLIGISSFFMGLSFVLYINYYITRYNNSRKRHSCIS